MPETKRARLDTRKLDNYQIIQLYYKEEEGRVPLTEKQEELKNRWEATFASLKKWENSTQDVLNDISKSFGVDKRTVSNDIKIARRLFDEELKLDWELITYKRYASLERAIKKAHREDDFSAIARLEAIIQKYKPKEVESPLIDPNKIKPHVIVLKSSKETLKRQMEENRRKAEQQLAEETSYETIE